mmetsp:Transcript_34955/g.42177  ORF Transcript_34955/g.42177 Transcript_34955/m.42177 type:complete len:648 (+) Transcript_34955:77-2020(+)|eukprot:CAMPEP_0194372594 /NCGR_PEP_ID=MMETSP0174-20130528/20985_1 /TAXON_ID=216777 /ORGANISM="Proboscia alata, Strain PI-D3" /LENGTH=647 /DNA_ID=CAMNT_0039151217 /DNA_START=36 /DNA_END=1979 /DNA_ORIENTATION=+
MHETLINDVENGEAHPPNEATPLNGQTDNINEKCAFDDHSLSSTATEAAVDELLETEKDEPWPHTFERSISLLAGPHLYIGDRDLDVMTRSPLRPTPQMTRRWRRAKPKGSDKSGYLSPEMSRVGSGMVLPPKQFSGGLKKMASLDGIDYNVGRQAQSSTQQIDQQRKLADAKAYRQKLLAQESSSVAQRKGVADHHDSPGYGKELEVDKAQKHAKQNQKSVDGKATFSQSLFNMCNILMGVGLLGMPKVFSCAGWYGGFIVLFLFSLITWWTSILIGRELNGDPRPSSFFDDSPYKSPLQPGSTAGARMLRPISSFPDIARSSFGGFGAIILSSVLYFELFSCLAIFFVSLGDHMHVLVPRLSTVQHQIIMAFVLIIPTAFLRTPKLLSYLSMVGTFATISVVSAVFLAYLVVGDISNEAALRKFGKEEPPYRKEWDASGLPLALGLMAYTFSGHAIVPSIYSSMSKPQEFERMITCTFLIVTFCCFLVAFSGYCMFGDIVDDQITISLETAHIPHAHFALTILMWLMVLTAFSKFTLSMFPLSLGIEEIAEPFLVGETTKEIASNVIRYGLILGSLLVAIFVPSFSFLCSLVGLVCTMIVSVIFPAGAHLKMFGPKLSMFEKIIDVVFVIFGSISCVVGTIATIG